MHLRPLRLSDAPFMLEWMHDQSVVKDLRTNFLTKTIEDCEEFIKNSWNDSQNWHVAITNENDEYMGTVSLKNIRNHTAEFGITIRKTAMGKNYAIQAMRKTLKIAFEEKCIKNVYWCVSPDNYRAVRFYDKNQFQRVEPETLTEIDNVYTKEQINHYIWYEVERELI